MQPRYLKQIAESLTQSCERAQSLCGTLDADALRWQPGTKRWSMAQCLEHMAIAAEHYNAVIAPAVDWARHPAPAADLSPRHTLAGRLILLFVEPDARRKMKTPRGFAPSQSPPSGDPVCRFVDAHETTRALAEACDGRDFNRIRFGSPEAWFIRLNAADAFAILTAHAKRHLNQAERVRGTPGFPA